jgi:hypothetical protein
MAGKHSYLLKWSGMLNMNGLDLTLEIPMCQVTQTRPFLVLIDISQISQPDSTADSIILLFP